MYICIYVYEWIDVYFYEWFSMISMQNDVRIRDYTNITLKNYNWCCPTVYHEGTKLQIAKIFSQIIPWKNQLVTHTNANPSRPVKDHLDPRINVIGVDTQGARNASIDACVYLDP